MSKTGAEGTAEIWANDPTKQTGLYETLRYAIARWGAQQVQTVLDAIVTHPPRPRVLPPYHWYCAKCESILPKGYWHNCDDKGSRSGPSPDAESSTGASVQLEVPPKDDRKWTD